MLLPLDIIWQPEAANKLQTSSTRLPLPLPRSSGFEKDVLLLIGRCGGTGGGTNAAGVGDIGDAVVPNFGGKGGAGGGRWCRKVLDSTVSGDIIKDDGIIGPFFGTLLG